MQTQTQAQSHAQSQTQDDDSAAAPTPGTVLCEDGLRRPPWAARDPLLREYYDTEWGVPVRDEAGLFERLVLE